MIKNGVFRAFFAVLICLPNLLAGQSTSSGDYDRLLIAPYISPQVNFIPPTANASLYNKLAQIISTNGMVSSVGNTPFILTPTVLLQSKDVLPTAPAKVVVKLEVTFFVGDGIQGTKFGSSSVKVKGVGKNEDEAYNAAFKEIKADQPALKELIAEGKLGILNYYSSQCDFILKEAETLAGLNKHDEALIILSGVPSVSRECYDRSMELIVPYYQEKINRECERELNAAKNKWYAGQDLPSAKDALEHLNRISPQASCFKEGQAFARNVAQKVDRLNDQNWEFILNTVKDQRELKEKAIEASRSIGVAFGNNQPQNIIYNIKGWW